MQLIDFGRFVGRRRVLIILVVIGGMFLGLNYTMISNNWWLNRRKIVLWSSKNAKRQEEALAFPTESNYSSSSVMLEPFTSNLATFPTESYSNLTKTDGTEILNESEGDDDNDYEPFYDPKYSSEFINVGESGEREETVFRNNLFLFACKNVRVRRAQKRNKNLIVFENFILSETSKSINCHESITYTTHGDYRYLDNILPLVDKWNGPVSIAIYCPADDLFVSLKIISFLRDCGIRKVRKFVTFHLFFDAMYFSSPVHTAGLQFQWLDSLYEKERWKNCSELPPRKLRQQSTFRIEKRLLYPVNIARNLARTASTTHFVFSSDVELYPSENIIPAFFSMMFETSKRSWRPNLIPAKTVYVIPIFEIQAWVEPPKTKIELVALLKSGDAIPFHANVCKECHLVPKYEEWLTQFPKVPGTLRVVHKAKRKFAFQYWEPIYIGTKFEPIYDERLSWEGLRDKMTQGYILCALDYDFLIVDNAFLIHRPGVKRLSRKMTPTKLRQDRLIDLKIKAELFRRFGKKEGCML